MKVKWEWRSFGMEAVAHTYIILASPPFFCENIGWQGGVFEVLGFGKHVTNFLDLRTIPNIVNKLSFGGLGV